jgi:hypothetical protein
VKTGSWNIAPISSSSSDEDSNELPPHLEPTDMNGFLEDFILDIEKFSP